MAADDANSEHWGDYSSLQDTKHKLIREYLNGWLPKLGLWSGRVLYFDTHAGRGRYLTGHVGSPIVAVTTLLQHSSRDRILAVSEVRFVFIEREEENAASLRREIAALGSLPRSVECEVHHGECFEQLDIALCELEASNNTLAPAFVFIDPFGFTIPMDLMARLLAAGAVELFVNVMWRELDMALSHGRSDPSSSWAEKLDAIFGSRAWLTEIGGSTSEQRVGEAAKLIERGMRAKWGTVIRMMSDGRTRYFLIHVTNHDQGRDLMKACMWKVCPDGSFRASKSDALGQLTLITPTPDLGQLDRWIVAQLAGGPARYDDLVSRIRAENWLTRHLNERLRHLRSSGRVTASGYQGRFAFNQNPLFELQTPSAID